MPAPSVVMSPRRRVAPAALVAALLLLLSLAGCGLRVQTNEPYTPAQGVNGNVGLVQVRDLMVISKVAGRGILSGTLTTAAAPDALTTVAGTAIASDGKAGTPLSVTMAAPVEFGSETPVLLSALPVPIELRSADLKAGLTVEVNLGFRTAGQLTLLAVVVDGTQPEYASIGPVPAATP